MRRLTLCLKRRSRAGGLYQRDACSTKHEPIRKFQEKAPQGARGARYRKVSLPVVRTRLFRGLSERVSELGRPISRLPKARKANRCAVAAERCPLLGPDFHRLERTKLAWCTHSITSSARSRPCASMCVALPVPLGVSLLPSAILGRHMLCVALRSFRIVRAARDKNRGRTGELLMRDCHVAGPSRS